MRRNTHGVFAFAYTDKKVRGPVRRNTHGVFAFAYTDVRTRRGGVQIKVLYIVPPTLGLKHYNYLLPLARAVESRGIDVTVMVPKENPASTGIRLVSYAENDFPAVLRSTLREVRPQVVQVESRPQIIRLVRQYFDGHLVLNIHSLQCVAGYAIPRHELRVALCLVDRIVLLSHFVKSLFLGRYYGLRLRAVAIHPGVDINKFSPYLGNKNLEKERLVLRKAWGVGKELAVLCASGSSPEKGLDVISRAWSNVSAKLIIVGDSSNYPASLQALGNKVIFLGKIDHDKMPSIYRAADLFVYPHQGREALGLANAEALASGLPVIASHRGGVTEIITERCGHLLRQYAEPSAWAAAISQVTSNPAGLRQMSLEARKRSLLFTWDRSAEQFMQVYGG